MVAAEKVFKQAQVIQAANAAKEGDVTRLALIIRNTADLKEVGDEGMTVTHFALLARKNAPQVMEMVLKAGADPISMLSSGDSVPQYAVMRDNADPAVVQVLLDERVDANWRPTSGPYVNQTLLMASLMGRNLPVAKLLVMRGADLNFVEPLRGSALHVALTVPDFFAAALLVDSGIDLGLKNYTAKVGNNPNVKSRTAIEHFCATQGGKRGANPLPRIAEGWKIFVSSLAARGASMPCGL